MSVLDDNKVVKKIVHLSDIHVRKTRIDEYKLVFDRTFERIRELLKEDDGVIVICGDVTDNKLMLTPVIVDQIKTFFIGLTNIADCICILGNHDVAISNKSAMDALTPILKNFETKNRLYLLKDNGLYRYGNIVFGVTNIYAKKVTPITKDNKDFVGDRIKVGLYHGTISGCASESGFKFTNSGLFGVRNFSKYYDYGLFGDIHSYQYLDRKKRFAYSSSLVEQRISETGQGHGFLLWNLEKGNSEYMIIENDYRYVILRLDRNKLLIQKRNGKLIKYRKDRIKVKYPKIRLYYRNTRLSQVVEIEKILEKNHEVTEIIKMCDVDDQLDFSYGLDAIEGQPSSDDKIVEIKDFETIKKLIYGFLQKYGIVWEKNKMKRVFTLLETIISDLKMENSVKKTIELKSLEFSNLFSYGEDNVVNFDKFGKNKIIGVLGQNGHGKSALMDALLFSIYDKFSRGANNDALNVDERMCTSSVRLIVNSNEYIIERSIKRIGKRRTQPSLELYKNGKLITNDRKSTTTQNIYDYVCNYEDIVNNNIILQFCENFLDINDSKKRDYLYRILNLDIFNKIVKVANSQKGLIKAREYAYKKSLEQYDGEKLEAEIKLLKEKENKKRKKMCKYEKKKEKLGKRLLELKMMIGCDDVNFSELEDRYRTRKKELEENKRDLEKVKKQIDIYENKYNKLIKNIDDKKHETFIKNMNNELKKLNVSRDNLMKQLVPLDENVDVTKLLKKLEKKLNDNVKKIKKLRKNGKKWTNKIVQIDGFSELKKLYECNEELKRDIDMVDADLLQYNVKVSEYEIKLEKLKEHKYNEKCECCMASQTTKEKIYFMGELDILNKKIKKSGDDRKKLDKKYDKNAKNKYDKMCKVVTSNEKLEKKIEDVNDEIGLIEKDIEICKMNVNMCKDKISKWETNKKLGKDIDVIDKKINDCNDMVDKEWKKYNKWKKELIDVEKTLDKCRKKFEEHSRDTIIIEKYITELEEKIGKIEKIECLKELEEDVLKYKNKITELRVIVKNICKQITRCECDMSKMEELKENMKECMDEYESYTEINNIIETRNGLVEHIMNKIVLGQIEAKVNSILSLLSDFLIELKYDNKKIVVYRKKDGLKAVNLCGFERFVCNMAFRLVFNQINTKLSCNFMIIDEGFSCCDGENLIRVKQLFNYIKQKYRWCLVITHLDTIKDYFDEIITIKKDNGKSKILI